MRVCDVDGSPDGLKEIGIGPANDPDADLTVAPGERPLARFDACAECRNAIEKGGLAALVERHVAAHKRRRKKADDATGK